MKIHHWLPGSSLTWYPEDSDHDYTAHPWLACARPSCPQSFGSMVSFYITLRYGTYQPPTLQMGKLSHHEASLMESRSCLSLLAPCQAAYVGNKQGWEGTREAR